MKDKEQVYIQTKCDPNEPNKPLLLHNGEIILTQGSTTLQGYGEIMLVWLPHPHLSFKAIFGSEQSPEVKKLDFRSYVKIRLPNLGENVETLGILLSEVFEGAKLTGIQGRLQAIEPIRFGSSNNLKEITLYLSNFHQTVGPLNIEAGSWLCKIKEIRNYYRFREELKGVEGYAITHTCQLSRTDKKSINSGDLGSMIDALYYFFSFARGFWCNLAQVQGFDASRKPVWGFWRAPTITNYIHVNSWFTPPPNEPDLSHALEVFLDLWSDETCQKALRTAIELYIEANVQRNVDTSIIIGQTGSETVSYIKNVIKGSMEKKIFEKNPAHKNIKLLLDQANIPYDMSAPSFHRLATYSLGNKVNGIETITQLRNGIVHPDKRDRVFKATPEERIAIRELALHYLELSLLFLFDFSGKYKNRMDNSEQETPWS
jgi:hypothetical protein